MPGIAIPLTRALLHPGGAAWRERVAGLKIVLAAIRSTLQDPRQDPANDTVQRARHALQADPLRLQELEDRIEQEISQILASALAEVPS